MARELNLLPFASTIMDRCVAQGNVLAGSWSFLHCAIAINEWQGVFSPTLTPIACVAIWDWWRYKFIGSILAHDLHSVSNIMHRWQAQLVDNRSWVMFPIGHSLFDLGNSTCSDLFG